MTTPEDLLSASARRLPPLAYPPAEYTIRINFDQGLPDTSLFPVAELRRCLNRVIDEGGSNALRYFGKECSSRDMQYGHQGLREQISLYLTGRDGRAQDVDGVVLVEGSTNGLGLAVNAYVGPGDGAVVEDPAYPYVRRFVTSAGGEIATVPVDAEGMVVDLLPSGLEALRRSGHHPKLISAIPTFHSPTGTVLSLDRRRRLLDIAADWGVIVLEDNCYYELYYDQPAPPSLLALDTSGLVLQSDSFSKTIAPGLRLAWLSGTSQAIEPVARIRQDFAVSQLLARAVTLYLEDGHFLAHIEKMRAVYREKRDIAVDALRRYCEPWVRFRVPTGGFYLWLEIDETVDWAKARDLAARAGVAVRPGDRFTVNRSSSDFVRLSWAQCGLDEISEGISILGSALGRSPR